MSDLTLNEKAMLESLFGMSGGYVLNFSNASFGKFFGTYLNIDIHGDKYTSEGTSKAKKLREFWSLEDNVTVGKSIKAMIEHYETCFLTRAYAPWETRDTADDDRQMRLMEKCKGIADRLLSSSPPLLGGLKRTFEEFDGHYLTEQIRRMELAVNDDPALAIGSAKELLESCCKTILHERGNPIEGNPDIPTLTKATLKELHLLPDQIPDHARGAKTIKRLLSNLGTIGQSLAELRNLYGTGHGKHGTAKGLSPRHAKLAVGSVSTLATFLYETHKETMS